MSAPFLAEIRMFGGNFAPSGWAFCNGQPMSINQYQAVFALVGTTYGGNGTTTFNLPDMRGRFPFSQGTGAGLSNYHMGEVGGTETVTLLSSQIPVHTHQATANNDTAGQVSTPASTVWCANTAVPNFISPTSSPAPTLAAMNPQAVTFAGQSLPHDNMPPFLAVTFIFALQGIFPSRN